MAIDEVLKDEFVDKSLIKFQMFQLRKYEVSCSDNQHNSCYSQLTKHSKKIKVKNIFMPFNG